MLLLDCADGKTAPGFAAAADGASFAADVDAADCPSQ